MTYKVVTTTPTFTKLKCSLCGDISRIRNNEKRTSHHNRREKARRITHKRTKCGTRDKFGRKRVIVSKAHKGGSDQ